MPKNDLFLLINSLSLPQFNNIEGLSKLTGLSTRLLFCLSIKSEKYYRKFNIAKKDGSQRSIYAPSYTMSLVQRWILINILEKIVPSDRAMAFRRGLKYGCKNNARYHMGTLYGLSIDLKDFFPSINEEKVYTIFKNLGYCSLSATILKNICTLNGELPQGGVCSPILSNIICISLDHRLIGLCEKRGVRYTRYADDMHFSSDNNDLIKETYPIIKNIIMSEGYSINDKKTQYHSPKNRRQINGITIAKKQKEDNYELKAKREIKKKIRAEIHRAIVCGDYSKRDAIVGMIANVNFIENEEKNIFKEKMKKYIDDCGNKIIHYEELINAFNKNLFFKDQNKIIYQNIEFNELLSSDEIEEYKQMISERLKYIAKNGIIDICKYSGFPECLTGISAENDEIIKSTPFDIEF